MHSKEPFVIKGVRWLSFQPSRISRSLSSGALRATRWLHPGYDCATTTSILDPVAMQVVAVGIEPRLGALDMAADLANHAPEPRRVVHLDEMGDFMGGQIVQHIGRREDQPPGKRQRSRRRARTPAARLITDRHPLDPHAEVFRI